MGTISNFSCSRIPAVINIVASQSPMIVFHPVTETVISDLSLISDLSTDLIIQPENGDVSTLCSAHVTDNCHFDYRTLQQAEVDLS